MAAVLCLRSSRNLRHNDSLRARVPSIIFHDDVEQDFNKRDINREFSLLRPLVNIHFSVPS